ncbi:hypothetical protein C8J56DRAFT_1025950 [Mycena floridula]|nr:hypothetical protein C8J56DRAFT_1025950 [Mycena floridula]
MELEKDQDSNSRNRLMASHLIDAYSKYSGIIYQMGAIRRLHSGEINTRGSWRHICHEAVQINFNIMSTKDKQTLLVFPQHQPVTSIVSPNNQGIYSDLWSSATEFSFGDGWNWLGDCQGSSRS